MNRSATRREINAYLAVEWDLDVDEVSDINPFELEYLGDTPHAGHAIYSFADDDEVFFAFSGPSVGYLPTAGMTV